jgi:hypothetical protein
MATRHYLNDDDLAVQSHPERHQRAPVPGPQPPGQVGVLEGRQRVNAVIVAADGQQVEADAVAFHAG